jgi:hypothetical protein
MVPLAIAALAASSGRLDTVARAIEPDKNRIDWPNMIEDIEIMGRILVKSLEPHYHKLTGSNKPFQRFGSAKDDESSDDTSVGLAHGYAYALGFYTQSLADVFGTPDLNVRGFYIPDTGVFYSLEVAVPTVLVAETEKTDVPVNLWKSTEDEVRRGGPVVPPDRKKTRHKATLDRGTVNITADSLLTAVIEHGANIDQLSRSDTITVAVRFQPAQTMLSAPMTDIFTTVSASPQRTIIQVPVSAIHDHAAGKKELERVKELTRTTHY